MKNKKEIKEEIDINKRFDELSEMEWAILARATNILREVFRGDKKLEGKVDWMEVMLFTAIGRGKSWNANLIAYAKDLEKIKSKR